MQGKPTSFSKVSEQAVAHRRRCKSLPPLKPGEQERLISEFLAVKSVTLCPARYVAPVERLPLLARWSVT